MIDVKVIGLRDLRGRFAKMADGGLAEYQRVKAEELGEEVVSLHSRLAPKSEYPSKSTEIHPHPFHESFHAHTEMDGGGFRIEVSTDEPLIEKWIREGTGIYGPAGKPITPKTKPFLAWEGGRFGEGWHFARSVKGMPARPEWAQQAHEESEAMIHELGNRIGAHVVHTLSGKPMGE